MLKIKNNVDLKELEKYGYTKNCNAYIKEIPLDYLKHLEIIVKKEEIFFRIEERGFAGYLSSPYTQKEFGFFKTRKYLKPLIKDGLVEKVEE